MITRVRRVSVAVVAALTAATACFAADPGGGPGQGGIGGQIGLSTFQFDHWMGAKWFDDYSAGAASRLAFHGHWRYQMNSWLRWQVGTGFTWSGYEDSEPMPFTDPRFTLDTHKAEMLTLLVPVSFQVHYVLRRGWFLYYAGGGPGAYRVWVQNRREVIKDPQTFRVHRGVYPGGSASLGVERFLRGLPNTSLEFAVEGHLALTQRHEQFPSGYDSNVMSLEARFGGNYYFTPGPRKASPPTKAP